MLQPIKAIEMAFQVLLSQLFRHWVPDELLQGKDEKRPSGQTATEYPVIRLLTEKFKMINLVVATDNW